MEKGVGFREGIKREGGKGWEKGRIWLMEMG